MVVLVTFVVVVMVAVVVMVLMRIGQVQFFQLECRHSSCRRPLLRTLAITMDVNMKPTQDLDL